MQREPNTIYVLSLSYGKDSPTTFKADGHTVHDYDKRFEMEDKGIIKSDEPFFWEYLKKPPKRQLSIFDLIETNERAALEIKIKRNDFLRSSNAQQHTVSRKSTMAHCGKSVARCMSKAVSARGGK